MSNEKVGVVVAWHNPSQIKEWCDQWRAWDYQNTPDFLFLEEDRNKEGCARTKNKGVRRAMEAGCDIVLVMDDDCFPISELQGLESWVAAHVQALQPMEVPMLLPVTNPISRGTPYATRTIKMPVAASVGFWTHIGDYDACAQLVRGARTPMTFNHDPMFGRYFPLCGMNIAFRPKDWLMPDGRLWCEFIDVPRFDDIWMGWLWQREAYRRGDCFNLNGPLVKHSRQSNVWQNLRDESKYLEQNETLWQKIATHPQGDYESLKKLLPV